MFADLSELSRNRPAGEPRPSRAAAVHSPREYFHSYLQSLDVERAGAARGLPGQAAPGCSRHYGVTDLDRTPELEAAVFRIFLAQQRTSADAAVVVRRCCAQWLAERAAGRAAARARRAGARAPGRGHAGALPRGVRPGPRRGVPLVRPAAAAPQPRPGLRRGPRATCATWTATRTRRTAPSGSQAMVASSEPLVRLLGQRIGRAGRDHAPLLEVLTRRYYGNRGLAERHRARGRGLPVRHRRARRRGGVTRVVATAVDFAALPRRHRRGRPSSPPTSPSTAWTPTSTSPGRTSRTPTRWRRALGELLAAHPLPARRPPGHHDRRRHQRRRDAPPLHLPARRRRASPRTG